MKNALKTFIADYLEANSDIQGFYKEHIRFNDSVEKRPKVNLAVIDGMKPFAAARQIYHPLWAYKITL